GTLAVFCSFYLNCHFEITRARAGYLLQRGGAADLGDVAAVLLVGNGVDVDLRRFVQTDSGDLGFAYIGFDEDFGEIGDDGDHRAGIVHRAGDAHFTFVRVELHGFAGDRREVHGALVGTIHRCNVRLRARHFDAAVRDRGDRSRVGGLVRGLLEIDEPLALLHAIAFGEVDLLDLADDMRADVDFDLGVDLAG